jgi:2-aminoadipate transaminase
MSFSERAERMQPSAIRQMTKLAAQAGRDLITFAGGMPNPATFPLKRLTQIATEEIESHEGRTLQYGSTVGPRGLLEWISQYSKKKGINASSENIICTNGSQQAIDLITEVLIDPGDSIFVENPTYLGALMIFFKTGARLVPVQQDQNGMVLEDLEQALSRSPEGKRKLIYLISNFQNPSGISLSKQRRLAIPELLEKYDAYLIEDDPYGEIYFGYDQNAPPNPIKASGSDRIFYLATASKLVAPTFRTGWVIAENNLVRRLELAREAADLCGSMLDQRIVYRFCTSPEFESHLRKLRTFYEERFHAMDDALHQEMPDGVRWTKPAGGFFIWLTLPTSMDAEALLEESVLKEKVSYVIGRPFTIDGSAKNCLRLAFSVEEPDRIREGIARLAKLIGRFL